MLDDVFQFRKQGGGRTHYSKPVNDYGNRFVGGFT
jgi:hypothetical protein